MTTTAAQTWPDARGRFGAYGGRYVPETLVAPLEELERAYADARADASFARELGELLRTFAGRPTPLQFAGRLSEHLGGPRIYLKREDLLHTGAHKINNCLGQALLAVRMGKRRIIAETGAGQHGVATATVAARFGLECVVYMGTEDMERQRLNVSRMRLLGAEVVGVDSGSRTLKDAINEAMRDWVTNVRTTHYLLGSVLGAHPYPDDGARFSESDRRRGARADSGSGGAAAGSAGGLRGRRLERHRALPRVSGRCQRENAGRGSGRSRAHARRTRGAPGRGDGIQRRASRRAAGHVHVRAADATGRSPRRIRFPRAWIIPRSGPSMRCWPSSIAPNTRR